MCRNQRRRSRRTDRSPLAFEEAQHWRPLDLWVDERQQLIHVARLPGEIDASDQLDSLRSHPQQCPRFLMGELPTLVVRRKLS